MMVPDRGFVKQLKKLDENLEVVWDWGSEFWEIWDFPKEGEPYMVTRVQTKDRNYRELGADILLSIQKSMFLGIDKILEYIDEQNAQIQRRKRQEFIDKIQWISRDNYETFYAIRGRPLKSTAGAPWLSEMPTLEKPKELRIAEGVKNA